MTGYLRRLALRTIGTGLLVEPALSNAPALIQLHHRERTPANAESIDIRSDALPEGADHARGESPRRTDGSPGPADRPMAPADEALSAPPVLRVNALPTQRETPTGQLAPTVGRSVADRKVSSLVARSAQHAATLDPAPVDTTGHPNQPDQPSPLRTTAGNSLLERPHRSARLSQRQPARSAPTATGTTIDLGNPRPNMLISSREPLNSRGLEGAGSASRGIESIRGQRPMSSRRADREAVPPQPTATRVSESSLARPPDLPRRPEPETRSATVPSSPPLPLDVGRPPTEPATVDVTIGRIEVKLASAPSRPARRPWAPASMTLDDYLDRRVGRSRA